MNALLLRFDAPLMSFGGPVVDNFGGTEDFPALSLLTGLIGNALGYDHADFQLLADLQRRLRYAVRRDRRGEIITDYQIVDLGKDWMLADKIGWTTRGRIDGRKGGGASLMTHQRYRDFLADGVYTVAIALVPADTHPTITDIEKALMEPERPLFLGRKSCSPASPLLLCRVEAGSLREAISRQPRIERKRSIPGHHEGLVARWSIEDGDKDEGQVVHVADIMDWENQVHTGRRGVVDGLVFPPGEVSDVG